jgi:hypothetical protein
VFSSRNKLYLFLIILCLAGYFWIYFNLTNFHTSVDLCLFKHVTKIPCPSCGSTRSIIQVVQGNILQAIYLNPLGLFGTLMLLITPIWILLDIIIQKKTLYNSYQKIETYFKNPKIAIVSIILIIINWIWNIHKEL